MAIITISGDLGSGKSSLTKCLVAKLGYSTFSAGLAFRTIAEERGVSVYELNKISETDKSIDVALDAKIADIGRTADNIIVDSRIGWHFIPHSFKIKLVVSSMVAAQRVMKDKGRYSEAYGSIEECAAQLKSRRQSEVRRFREFYNADIKDDNNFDLVINTNDKNQEEVCEIALAALKNRGIV